MSTGSSEIVPSRIDTIGNDAVADGAAARQARRAAIEARRVTETIEARRLDAECGIGRAARVSR